MGFPSHEGDTLQARISTPQPCWLREPSNKWRLAALHQFPRDKELASTSLLSSDRRPTEVIESVNHFQSEQLALEFESCTGQSNLNQSDPALGLQQNSVPESWLARADRKARYTRPGCLNRKRSYTSEKPMVTSARNKQPLICHKGYI